MSEWDESAAGWDDSEPVRAYAAAAFDSLLAHLTGIGVDVAGATACDFGCGTGLLTERLAVVCGAVDAVDTSPAMLEVLGTKIAAAGWTHVRALAALPEEVRSYDLVVCSSVLAFVDDYPTTVEQLVGHLAGGGVFVQWDWELDPAADEPFGFTPERMRRVLEGAGLESVEVGRGFEAAVEDMVMRPLMGTGRRPA